MLSFTQTLHEFAIDRLIYLSLIISLFFFLESGEEYSPLMVIAFMFSLWIICITLNEMYNYSSIVPSNPFQVINEMNDSVLNKEVEMKEAWSIQEGKFCATSQSGKISSKYWKSPQTSHSYQD